MGYLGRRIGKSADTGNVTEDGTGGGLLDLWSQGYFQRQGNIYNAPGVLIQDGLTATGGVISDYTDGPSVYRAHIFTSSGTFEVTEPGAFGDTVETFAIGGGGGGSGGFPGYGPGRGGGAGGAFVVTSYPVSVATYPISVGAGGAGAATGPGSPPFATGRGTSGGNSTFTDPSPQVLTAAGGGGGGDYDAPSAVAPNSSGGPGGCGGGGGGYPGAPSDHFAGGTATQPSQNPGVANLTNYGFAGGTGDNTTFGGGGGGGGTGGVGDNYSSPTNTVRSGGPGIPNVYAYGPGTPVTYGAGGPTGGPNTGPTVDATYSTGDGGMGWLTNPDPSKGANGGSGIVVVRYQIAELTATAKATGGAISFYGDKTIHTFTSSGDFNAPASISDVEYVCVGGGGAGGTRTGGGGGAGGYVTATGQTIASGPWPIVIGAGGSKIDDNTNNPATPGNTGSNTVASFPGGTVTAGYGGGGAGGGSLWPQGPQTAPLGSGGGGCGGTLGTPTQGGPGGPQGYPAGPGNTSGPAYGGGGGGGAGGSGGAGAPFGLQYGRGGFGVQLPATFRNPVSIPTPAASPSLDKAGGLGAVGPGPGSSGPNPGLFWVAGGGGGGDETNPQPAEYGVGGGGIGIAPPAPPSATPYAGAGSGGDSGTKIGGDAIQNTGSGGGGGGHDSNYRTAGNGGSGLVLIAYPS